MLSGQDSAPSTSHHIKSAMPLSRDQLITEMPNLLSGDIEEKRQEIKRYFNLTYEGYEALFETLVDDSVFYLRPCSLRHPLIFYFGHTATFFTNKLVLAKLLPHRINARIESMCAIGVDEMSWDDLDENSGISGLWKDLDKNTKEAADLIQHLRLLGQELTKKAKRV